MTVDSCIVSFRDMTTNEYNSFLNVTKYEYAATNIYMIVTDQGLNPAGPISVSQTDTAILNSIGDVVTNIDHQPDHESNFNLTYNNQLNYIPHLNKNILPALAYWAQSIFRSKYCVTQLHEIRTGFGPYDYTSGYIYSFDGSGKVVEIVQNFSNSPGIYQKTVLVYEVL